MHDTPQTVSQVTERIRGLLEADSLLGDLWISGEVLESSVSRAGHVFFTMADENARLRCVLFRMNALRQRILPSPGAVCVAHGRIEVYATDGSYQFYVDLVQDAGISLAALELELLRQQLEAEGLFSESRKRPIPARVRTIGVVTSGSGAVWHDIQNVVRRRFPFAHLIMASSAVQGESAPRELVAAVRALVLDGRPDVLVIARGGGSASDLAAFNDETLVRAVFAAPIPVVSAVGHETDWTLLDLVADSRAPTPSAAAELVTPALSEYLEMLREKLSSHTARAARNLTSQTMDLDRLTQQIERVGPAAATLRVRRQMRELQTALVTCALDMVSSADTNLGALSEQMNRVAFARLDHDVQRLNRSRDLMAALSPAQTMARGYAFVEHPETGRRVRSVHDVAVGDHIRTRLLDGAIDSSVSHVVKSM